MNFRGRAEKDYLKNSFIYLVLISVFFSCAKDQEFETVYKEPEIAKIQNTFDLQVGDNGKDKYTKDTFLYVPSTLGAPKDVEAAFPYFKGTPKLVKLRFTNDDNDSNGQLEVLELEKDARFSDNEFNHTPVLSIPVKYKSFRCREDDEGRCTGEEEENTEIAWQDKDMFLPDFTSMSINEVNKLDIFGLRSGCITPISTGLVDYEMSKGVLNIEIEKTFRVSTAIHCIAPLFYKDLLSTAGFKMRFFYSLVRVKDLKSKDYQPVSYPIQDHDTFGFFKTKIKELDNVYDGAREDISYLMNRWNPNRKKIVYHMSPNFNKKKNRLFKKATIEAFKRINKGLERANVKFKLVLKDKKKVTTGDLRYNTINLISDPLRNGILGYGPSVALPDTGEIVHAHVNMYSGVLLRTLKHSYEQMADLSQERANKATFENKSILGLNPVSNTTNNNPAMVIAPTETQAITYDQSVLSKLGDFENSDEVLKHAGAGTLSLEDELYEEEKDDLGKNYEQKLKHLGKMAADTTDLFNIAQISKTEIPGIREIKDILNENGALKRWRELSDSQQEQVIEIMLPFLYIQTLVHEVGHNLGLRHNFLGSYDKDNFYTKEEIEQHKIQGTPAYSSIMDYGHSNLNSLGVFGKYDVAALRFAYAREVELEDRSILKIDKPLHQVVEEDAQKIHRYKYCTDENAGLSATCNRFDEGTSLVEISEQYVKQYVDGYKYRNYRNERNEFSTYGITGSVSARAYQFKRARVVFEEFELFASIFGKQLMEQGCTPEMMAQYAICKDINDRRDAVKIISKFYLDILKTPDLTCHTEKTLEDGSKTEVMVKLKTVIDKVRYQINYIPKTCFDTNVIEYLKKDNSVVLGEAGRFLNHIKDNNPLYKYKTDIAVRGVWHDKLLAMKYLTVRYLGLTSTEDIQSSMTTLSQTQAEIFDYLSHLLIGTKLNAPIKFKKADGTLYEKEYTLGDEDKIFEQPRMNVIRFFGLPSKGSIGLNKMLIKTAFRNSYSQDREHNEEALKFMEAIGIYRKADYDIFTNPAISTVQEGRYIYGAAKRHVFAKHMIDSMNALDTLNSISIDKIKEVYAIRFQGAYKLPDTLTPEELEVGKMGEKNIDEALAIIGYNIPNLSLELLMQYYPEEKAKQLFAAISLGVEKLNMLKAVIAEAKKAPADATEEVKFVFNLDGNILKDFVEGKLETNVKNYQTTIEYLNVLN